MIFETVRDCFSNKILKHSEKKFIFRAIFRIALQTHKFEDTEGVNFLKSIIAIIVCIVITKNEIEKEREDYIFRSIMAKILE